MVSFVLLFFLALIIVLVCFYLNRGVEFEQKKYLIGYEVILIGVLSSILYSLMDNEREQLILTLIFIIIGSLIILYNFLLVKEGKIEIVIKKHNDKAVYLLISLTILSLMVHYSGIQSFWGDELCQIGLIEKSDSLFDLIKMYNKSDAAPPLFPVLAYIWYHIVPYGEKWLLLLPEIFVAISTYVIGITGKTIKNKTLGVFSSLCMALSYSIICFCGFEFRQYGLLLFSATIALYAFVIRIKTRDAIGVKVIILFALCIWMLPMSQYLAIIVCLAYFIIEFVLVCKKEMAKSALLSYLFAGLAYLPWAIYLYIGWTRELKMDSVLPNWWGLEPSLSTLKMMLVYLTGYDEFMYLLFFIGAACILACICKNIFCSNNKCVLMNEAKINNTILSSLLFIPLFMVAVIVLYYYFSISGGRHVSYLVGRYLFCTIPHIIMIMALGCHYICVTLGMKTNNSHKTMIKASLFIFLALMVGYNTVLSVSTWTRGGYTEKFQNTSNIVPYRQGANWIMDQKDIYDKDTVVCLVLQGYTLTGEEEYYFSKQGERKGPIIIGYDNISLIDNFETVYVFSPAYQWESSYLQSVKKYLAKKGYYEKSSNEDYWIYKYEKQ